MGKKAARPITAQDIAKEGGFEKFVKVSAPGIITTLKSSLVLEQLGQKEGLAADPVDVEDQLNLARQRAEGAHKPARAAY